MDLTLPEIKLYLRIDHIEDDEFIKILKQASETYLFNAGIKKSYENALYKLAILLLISNSYENRTPVLVGSISKAIEFSLQSIITQLQLQPSVKLEGRVDEIWQVK